MQFLRISCDGGFGLWLDPMITECAEGKGHAERPHRVS